MPGAMAAPTDGFEVAGIVGFRRRSAENVVNLLRGRPAVHTAASGAPEHESRVWRHGRPRCRRWRGQRQPSEGTPQTRQGFRAIRAA
jgi:hypothetical protein